LKVLIAYGTRYGATAGTSEEISRILREKNFNVKITDVKAEKIRDITEYDLIIVGSGMRMGKWVSEAEDFLEKFQKELNQKKLAIFVSSMRTFAEKLGKTQEEGACSAQETTEKILTECNLKPISVGIFGGVINYNKMGFFERKMMGFLKSQFEKDGFKETEPGFYDLRDWDEIRTWASELAEKAR